VTHLVNRRTPEGDDIAILKDRARGRYFRLSRQGLFIWERLDGRHSVRDLALEYMQEFHAFAPQAIADELGRLATSGFILVRAPIAELRRDERRDAGSVAKRILTWHADTRRIDPLVACFYSAVGRLFYAPAVLAVLVVIGLSGLVAFFAEAREACPTPCRSRRSTVDPRPGAPSHALRS
jgi:putative peptide zinc metalloprotease protein